MSALLDLSMIFRGFLVVPPPPQAAALRKLYLQILVERWPDVMRWLAFVLMISPSTSNVREVLNVCVDTLFPIIVTSDPIDLDAETQALTEELVYLPYTIDFLYLLLAQRDPSNGRYHYLGDPHGCKILGVLNEYVKNKNAFMHLLNRLRSVKPSTRRGILRSLVYRAREIAEGVFGVEEERHKYALMSAMQSLYTLIFCTSQLLIHPALYRSFAQRDFLFEFAESLAMISGHAHRRYPESSDKGDLKDFWKLMSVTVVWTVKTVVMERTPNPIVSFPSAVRGGILDAALTTLTHLDPEGNGAKMIMDDVLIVCLSYLTYRGVWNGAMARGEQLEDALSEARRTSRGARTVCKSIRDAIERGERTYKGVAGERRKKDVRLCGNRKVSFPVYPPWSVHENTPPTSPSLLESPSCAHATPKAPGLFQKAPEIKYQTCAGCHILTYCSEKCQQEDWVEFHHRECTTFSKWYQDRKASGCWTSLSTRRDQLLYLEDLANEILPPLPAHNPVHSKAGVKQLMSAQDYALFNTTASSEPSPSVTSPSNTTYTPTPKWGGMKNPSLAKDPKTGKPRAISYHPDTTVALFDFVSHEGLANKQRYPIHDYHEKCWKYINLPWADRVAAMVKDVEDGCEPGLFDDDKPRKRYTLVEGIFMYNASLSIFVLVKMGWDEKAPGGRQYKVEDSVWRLGPRSVTEELWGAGFIMEPNTPGVGIPRCTLPEADTLAARNVPSPYSSRGVLAVGVTSELCDIPVQSALCLSEGPEAVGAIERPRIQAFWPDEDHE
ncbi:hypothetical protein NMY22_g11035 [Coprinellus aureogranulatus]|nr:hypothetical protein NMY22_g11035 [Coprinellus aureogranulatus]